VKAYDDVDSYKHLDSELAKIEGQGNRDRSKTLRLYYIALPPSAFKDVVTNVRQNAWHHDIVNRVIVEKPYGKDYASAKELSAVLEKLFTEEEVYRIDHYLGKDTTQSILPLRFGGNPFFTKAWDRSTISHVTINFKEPFGAEGRGGYFDEFGMMRDVSENHLMQILVMIGVEKPSSLSIEDLHRKKVDFIKSCQPIKKEDVFVAQYGASTKDKDKKAYKDDETVKDDSKASTFATCILYCNNERWQGVPFIIRAGKGMQEMV